MTVLPRALYLFHTLLILIPKQFFFSLQATLRDFIWAGKKPRISMQTLMRTKAEGGINLPHFKLYYYATHLTRILDWNCHARSKAWVNLESLNTETPLRFLPWVNKEARTTEVGEHPTIGPTLKIFQIVSQLYNLASSPGPLTPLVKNREFALGHTTKSFPHRDDKTPLTVAHCLEIGRLKTFTKLQTELQAKHFTHWQYRQLHDYILCPANKEKFLREQTSFEKVCLAGEQVHKATSLIYSWLRPSQDNHQSKHKLEWETALQKSFTDTQWNNACILAHKCSISTSNQETSYKILTNWYFTPARLHSWFPEISENCWRCGSAKGDMLHIWWYCPSIRAFWDSVCARIQAITETGIALSPECCLLHISNYSLSRYKKSIVRHMLNAAKTIIPRHWKTTLTHARRMAPRGRFNIQNGRNGSHVH